MEQALDAVVRGMSIIAAAKKFQVEKEALRERFDSSRAASGKRGRPSYLAADNENEVLQEVATRAQAGVRVDKTELRDIIRHCALAHKPTGVPDTFPNGKWVQRFMLRHKTHFSNRRTRVRPNRSTGVAAREDASRSEAEDTVHVQETVTNPAANSRHGGENVSITLESVPPIEANSGEDLSATMESIPSTAVATVSESAQERELIAQRCVELIDSKLKRELAAQKHHTDQQVNRLEKMHREQQIIQQEQHSQLLAAMQQQQMMMSKLMESLAPNAN